MDNASAHFFNQRLLIAMPDLVGSVFDNTLIYMVDHTFDGAMGLVINRPTNITLSDVIQQLRPEWEIPKTCDTIPILYGGPVQPDKGFVIHSQDERFNSVQLSDGLYLSNAQEVLYTIAEGQPPSQYNIFLGCTGWDSGQLEKEVINNSWWVTDFDIHVLLEVPLEERLSKITKQLGFDLSRIHPEAGHA